MVTNINLAAPEAKNNKSLLTGKSTLALSGVLLALSFIVLGLLSYLKNNYSLQSKQIEESLAREKMKMTGAAYADLFDFQERLILLDGVLNDHNYLDIFLKNFSRYVIPDVRLTNLSFDNKNISLKGVAPNFEALSREMILLKSYSGADSVEFKGASENAASESGQGGVSFDLGVGINKSVLKK